MSEMPRCGVVVAPSFLYLEEQEQKVACQTSANVQMHLKSRLSQHPSHSILQSPFGGHTLSPQPSVSPPTYSR